MPAVPVLKNYNITEADDKDVEWEFASPSFTGSHASLIPMMSAVQPPRVFYGARFYNQAMPLEKPEQPWVQNLMDEKTGESYDEHMGRYNGAQLADDDGEVVDAQPDKIIWRDSLGKTREEMLYNGLPFNRKSRMHQTPVVKAGDKVRKGQTLARSNFTDENGVLAMGLNARVAVVPYLGYSMDDATVVSEDFAKRLRSEHTTTTTQEFDDATRGGKSHFYSALPTAFTQDQLKLLDDEGVVRPGTRVKPGDPLILATRPKVFSSTSAHLGKLSKAMRQTRGNASQVWDGDDEAEVTDVAKTKNGWKVVLRSFNSAREGDKVVFRAGAKGVISAIIPNQHMPRTEDGKPLDVLYNPLGLVSRANDQMIYELLLGKVAEKNGKPIKMPAFSGKGTNWYDVVEKMLADNKVNKTERVYDPMLDRFLNRPVTVGNGFLLKLHHTAACFDDQTEVLTDSGWKRWATVTMEDKLATSDTHGQQLLFEKPLHLFSYDYEGLMCAFQGRYLDYMVTPNHNLWCKFYYGERCFGLRQASDMHGKRFKVKQFGLLPTCPGGPEKFILEGREFDWDDFCEFTGWWVSEGCCQSRGGGVVIYQSQSANPLKVARIEALITRMGLKWAYFKSEGRIMGFQVHEKSFARYFANYGSHSQFKHVPRELILGRLSGCARLIESMQLGDGCHQETATGPTMRYTTTSKQLADDFQELCIRVGDASVIRPVPPEQKKHAHHLDKWVASHSGQRTSSQVDGDRAGEGFSMPFYQGKVFCAEMRTGLLYVRRNGKPMLSGNSKSSSRAQGGYDCFDSQTEVFTQRGWVAWPDVGAGDKLLDPAPREDGSLGGGFVTPLKLFSAEYEGEMLQFTSKYLDWQVTPNHNFYIQRETHGPVRKLSAQDLMVGTRCTIPCAAAWLGGISPEFFVLPGVPVPQFASYRRGAPWPYVESLNVPFSDYVEFAAWYISEGSVQLDRRGRYRVFIWQSAEASPKESERIEQLLGRLGVEWYPVKRKGRRVGYAFQDARWAEVAQQWGTHSHLKRVPENIKNSCYEMRALFLHTYMLGDGHHGSFAKRDGRVKSNVIWNVSSSSARAVLDLEFIVNSLGYASSILEMSEGEMTCPDSGKTYPRREHYRLNIHVARRVASVVRKQQYPRNSGEWKSVPYSGRIYCATMPSGRLLVRRNGKMCVTGNSNEQPSKGGDAGAKRVSGLEGAAMLSSGAYHNLREVSTLRGQHNPEYWQQLRQGLAPKEPGAPFVWRKYRALLQGAGLRNKDVGGGKIRLGPMTDRDVDALSPMEIKHGGMVNMSTFEPEPGGLFDTSLVSAGKWGFIPLSRPVINPAAEDSVRHLLGMTKAQLEDVLAGRAELPEHLR